MLLDEDSTNARILSAVTANISGAATTNNFCISPLVIAEDYSTLLGSPVPRVSNETTHDESNKIYVNAYPSLYRLLVSLLYQKNLVVFYFTSIVMQ